jgi:hypothetical protein
MILNSCFKNSSGKERVLNCVAFFTILFTFIPLLTGIYWLTYPYEVLTINEHPLKVLSRQVQTDGIVMFELDYCKHMNIEGTISRRFIDGLIYSVPNITVHNEPGCRKVIITEDIPNNLPPSEYVMDFHYTYQVNPLRKITVHAHTQKFTVEER